MKIHKKTAIYTIIIGMASFVMMVWVYCLELTSIIEIIRVIMSGISTGMIVSFTIALVGYFVEKEKIVVNTKNQLISLFTNINTLEKTTNMLSKFILSNKNITIKGLQSYLNYINGLSNLNTKILQDMNIDLFYSFYPKSKLTSVFKDIKQYKYKIYKLSNTTTNVSLELLKYLSEEYDKNLNLEGMYSSVFNLLDYQETTNNELDGLIFKFFTKSKIKESWQEHKDFILEDVEQIIKDKVPQ